jgi:mannitol/fructose-specific phosphotransferase system IIA component (Ntr-type)
VLLSQVFRENSVVYLEKRGKTEVIKECVEHLVKTGRMRETRVEKAVKTIVDREKIGTTGIGEGIAVPHAELEFLKSFLGVIGVSRRGVDYKALDGNPVHYIFLFLTPTGRREEHMELLRDIVKFVRKGNYLRFLQNADSPAEIHDLIREMEEE